MVHARYLDDLATDPPPGASRVPPSWEELDDESRELNRTSVDEIALKLLRIGYRIVDADNGDAFTPTTLQLEYLAQEEHDRWCQARLAAGWSYGAKRNDKAKLHPDLVPWEGLPESRRRIDRNQVAAISELLAASHKHVLPLTGTTDGPRNP